MYRKTHSGLILASKDASSQGRSRAGVGIETVGASLNRDCRLLRPSFGYSRPNSRARAVHWVRLLTFSLPKML